MNAPLRQAPELRPIHADITRERWRKAHRAVRSIMRRMPYAEGNGRQADLDHLRRILADFPAGVQGALCRDRRGNAAEAARIRRERVTRLLRMIGERECNRERGVAPGQAFAAFRIAQELGRPMSRINVGEWLRTS